MDNETLRCCGRAWGDPDELFSFTTVKIVRINDRRLGSINLLAQVIIIAYIVANIIINRSYMLFEQPVGTVAMSLRAPTAPLPSVEDLPYCLKNSTNNSTDTRVQQEMCIYDDRFLLFRDNNFVVTRVTKLIETRNATCELPLVPPCAPRETLERQKYFAAAIEDFTVRFVIQVRTARTDVVLTSGSMEGEMVDRTGHQVAQFTQSGQSDDIVTLGQILSAGGVSLSDVIKERAPETLRDDGLVVLIMVACDNSVLAPNTYTYVYTVQPIIVMDGIKIEKAFYTDDHSLHVENLHGIQFAFLVTGQVGTFSFVSLCVHLVSALVLLGLSSIVVEFVALNYMKEKEIYRSTKFQVTQNYFKERKQRMSQQIPNHEEKNERAAEPE